MRLVASHHLLSLRVLFEALWSVSGEHRTFAWSAVQKWVPRDLLDRSEKQDIVRR
jgi:hypothetical protein